MSESDQIDLLTGPEARLLVAAALNTEGSDLVGFQLDSLHHRPGAGVSAGYIISVATPGGGTAEQYVCATTGRITRPQTPGLVRLDHPSGEVTVHVWRHPNDPELPALSTACDSAEVSRLVGAPVEASIVSYRPTRRCVLRATDDAGVRAFLKVVRPKIFPDLVRRHEVLTAAGVPVPRVTHADERGLAVLSTAEGYPLSRFLSQGLDDDATTLNAVIETLDLFPREVMELPRHPSWSERVEYYGHAAATVLPDESDRAHHIVNEVARMMRASDPGPVVPTHGDFYEANVFLSSQREVSAILDVDAVGPGHRVDDLACLLGHVSVLPALAPASYPEVASTLAVWWEFLLPQVDRVALAARAAAVTLSLVAGAKKTTGQEWRTDALARLAQAEHWLTLA